MVVSPETVASISLINGSSGDSAYMMDDGTEYGDAVLAAGFLSILRQLDSDTRHCWRSNSGSWHHSYIVLYEHYEDC